MPNVYDSTKQVSRFRRYLLPLTSAFFVAAGCSHFAKTDLFAVIVPPQIPDPRMAVCISGASEIAGGVGLLFRPSRKVSAVGLALLLAAVFPANYYMAAHDVQLFSKRIPRWLLWARLPFQLPMIWWVLSLAGPPIQASPKRIVKPER